MNLKDFSKKIGINPSTISRALNNYPDISQQTKDTILKLAKKHNYNPNKSAQQIRKDLKSAIGKVRKSKDPKVLNTLKTQLDRLNAIGGLKSVVPSEGITFVYKGKLYNKKE